MRKKFLSALVLSVMALPTFAYALDGSGPRATVTGIINEVRITEKQAFSQEGGELTMTAENGQKLTIVLDKYTKIISQGNSSRKQLIPANLLVAMRVRVTGWRLTSDSLSASMIIILNAELNPSLSASGVFVSSTNNSLTMTEQDGKDHTYQITNETQVNINYTLYGTDAITLVGKQVFLTLNPINSAQVRIVRISGRPADLRKIKPSSADLGIR